MILPTKQVTVSRSLLGVGATLLSALDGKYTVSRFWEKARGIPAVGSFQRFVLTLDLLYAIGAIVIEDGLLAKSSGM
jgi:hypothetical protein